ncbi:transmembrane protein 125 [Dunckerocampus dactyliophorus]|uniref:transmembrane protein 125 n=1 Tax=Dunckerocampus dactyliophorus TaxID=161453 RepID=UPI002405CC1F|nr:transmembrane protein 125 [Dunckerocampus dactyliophorus]
MPELQLFYPPRHDFQPPSLYLDLLQRRAMEDQVNLWWFGEPRHSLMCYCASVALILGLGLGGVCLLSTITTSMSSEWRLGVGTTLCLLSLAVLLKQLLSSAIQDMNCVHSRRRIDQLKSGGQADPALILVVGVAVMLCGTVLLCVTTINKASGEGDDSVEMLVSGLVLMAAGLGMALAVAAYGVLVYFKRRREQTRRMRAIRARRLGRGSVRVFCVSGGQLNQARRETASSRTSLI